VVAGQHFETNPLLELEFLQFGKIILAAILPRARNTRVLVVF
jgi:hypothetical protein